ncbi:hypothetical protein FRB90_003187 [Tulasnella sp. 427]|nr:hypothetical protein FRB90_003187 [Tulasnella sp. 427]
MLSPNVSLPAPRLISNSVTTSALYNGSPSSGGKSLSTPSPLPSQVDEDEILGDDAMMGFIRRTQARRFASGARQADLDEMLKFPDPSPPVPPSSSQSILKSSQAVHLSDYERKEILDYPSVYCIGANSEKKPATPRNLTNNFGYDALSKKTHLVKYFSVAAIPPASQQPSRSFGTRSVSIITPSWRSRSLTAFGNGKHHAIKMTEHFYFCGHLCIAMALLSNNLDKLIKAKGFVGLITLIRQFTSQMLASIALMRHYPVNVLLRRPDKSGNKVIDLAAIASNMVYTCIQSRSHRSPEVILGMK